MSLNVVVLEHPRIRSPLHFNDIANTPLWSCLLAGYAAASMDAAGAEVELLDANRSGWDFSRTLREVLDRSPDLVCVHAVYFWEHTPRLLDFLRNLRGEGFGGHLNLFGFFPTLARDLLLPEAAAVDSIAVGECEETLARLARRLETGRSWRDLPGLASRNGGPPSHCGAPRSDSDPDRFPMPWRRFDAGETVSVLASRGCYNHCRFCPVPSFYDNGPKWRGRRPEAVAEEVAHLRDRGAGDFYFVDPNFVGPGPRGRRQARSLARRLAPLKIRFGMETRAEDLDAGLMEAFADAGLHSLLLGIESGSPRILRDLQKHSSPQANENAIRLCREAGIEPEVGFLMFVPDATPDDLQANFDFLRRNRLLDRLDRTANLLCHRQIVFRGTPGFRQYQAEDRIAGFDPLGFQADVTWADPGVGRIAEIIGHACLHVIAATGDPESPLYWRGIGDRQIFRRVNDHLVTLFEDQLALARRTQTPPPAAETMTAATADLNHLIHRPPTHHPTAGTDALPPRPNRI